jgi:hypothetical protein
VANNRDLFAIRKATETTRTTISILTAESGYKAYSIKQQESVLGDWENAYKFCVAPNRDIVAIRTNETEYSLKMLVRILSADTNYQTFSRETSIPIAAPNGYWHPQIKYEFGLAVNRDLYVIKAGDDTPDPTVPPPVTVQILQWR